MHNINLRIVVFGLFLFFTFAPITYAQNPQKEILSEENKEKMEVDAFARQFMKNFNATFDLTKVPTRFFVMDFKKINAEPLFESDFDNELTAEEKYRSYLTLIDFSILGSVLNLIEDDFDLKKVSEQFNKIGISSDETSFLPRKMIAAFRKNRKLGLFVGGKNDVIAKGIEDVRETNREFRRITKSLRVSITPLQKKKYLKFVSQNDKLYFNFGYSFECSGENCEGFPEKTKLTYFRTFPFDLLITEINRKYKVIKVSPASD
jgi:hypothetical protein